MKLLDQIKIKMQDDMRKIYREIKPNLAESELNEFQNWFWKIRPLLEVNLITPNSQKLEENQNAN